MHHLHKRCHIMIMSRNAMKTKAAFMPFCSLCAAAVAATRPASAVWSAAAALLEEMVELGKKKEGFFV
ncbi:hypothetical protein P3X46_010933 [Hevea brasiliensis]|uniref:Secreted protein n=1 Tax=Hevea brasiliensis TaxID=3981 RepID=A0ABQ9MJF8_HEVBR|nr:hypothetical protein P3X46_010933 [Hevea brasiliensis]